MVGWQNDSIVAIGSISGVVSIPSDGGEPRAYRVGPESFWGASPSGNSFVSIDEDGGSIVSDDGRVPIDISGALGDGTWSWDGATIAVVSIGAGAATQLVVIDAATGDATEPRAGAGAQGNVVWAQDSQSFAFVRVKPDQRARLEAVLCETDGSCEPAFSWDEGVTLLGFSAI
jgi:Tol biopolymer transport system component